MNDDVDPAGIPLVPESAYEPPEIFDFGPVFKITRGNGSGTVDKGFQED